MTAAEDLQKRMEMLRESGIWPVVVNFWDVLTNSLLQSLGCAVYVSTITVAHKL